MEFLVKTAVTLAFLLLFQTAEAQDFNTVMTAFEKSYTYEKQNEINQAIQELKKVYYSDSYEISLRLGWLNYLQGNFTESASHYRHAVELKSYSEEAKMGLVLPLSASGKWDEVIHLYNKILDNNPKNLLQQKTI
jgi:tetratricopeptide (TPR) repeat protein